MSSMVMRNYEAFTTIPGFIRVVESSVSYTRNHRIIE